MLCRLCKSYRLQCRDISVGVSKSFHGGMPSLILSVREIGESRNYNTWSMYRAEEGHGRGGGEKEYFSLSDASPAPYESPHCLDYFRIQHCGCTNKNNHTPRENAWNAGYIKAYLTFESDGGVLCA